MTRRVFIGGSVRNPDGKTQTVTIGLAGHAGEDALYVTIRMDLTETDNPSEIREKALRKAEAMFAEFRTKCEEGQITVLNHIVPSPSPPKF